jgi:hypothetical protein
MMYENLLKDFTVRTRHNLSLIEAQKDVGHEAFETTQLINSLLGLLVLPQERMLSAIPDLPLSELHARGWPAFESEGSFRPPRTLKPLVRYLRNAVAHFNIEFLPDESGEIGGVILTNRWNNDSDIPWRVRLPLKDLRKLVECFSDLLLEQTDREGRVRRGFPASPHGTSPDATHGRLRT